MDAPESKNARPRVELRSLRQEDSEVLFRWINLRELVTLSAPFRPVAREEHDAWFREIRERDDVRIFGIRRCDDDVLIGSCQLHSIHPTHQNAELQIRIAPEDQRGLGLGAEALRALLAFGFGDMSLHRIFLHVFASNKAAIAAYQRVGFRHEGTLREAALIEGRWVDVLLMAILQEEWRALQ